MELLTVKIDKPEDCNVILGQSHFIKTVEDLHEAVVNSVPNVRFGLAFCEASGPCLVRASGNDPELKELAQDSALALSAGHTFVIFVREAYPLNLIGAIKQVAEVCSIFCATANPLEVIIGETEQGRGVLGVIDGFKSKGIETEGDVTERKTFLRKIGYKL
jgi:adenosine/AMP kinase